MGRGLVGPNVWTTTGEERASRLTGIRAHRSEFVDAMVLDADFKVQ